MIVDPDFLDHWKTQMLCDAIGHTAPIALLRLWSHCQQRREWRFANLPNGAVRAICRHDGDADELCDAMEEAGFISREDGVLEVVGWDEYNAQLIANWKNGKKGGRPKKNPSGNQSKTHGKPMDNPVGSPSKTDKIGCDRIGEEGSGATPPCTRQEAVTQAAKFSPPMPETNALGWFLHRDGDGWTKGTARTLITEHNWRSDLEAWWMKDVRRANERGEPVPSEPKQQGRKLPPPRIPEPEGDWHPAAEACMHIFTPGHHTWPRLPRELQELILDEMRKGVEA